MTKTTINDTNIDIFEHIASDLIEKGYSINPNALPPALTESLLQQLQEMNKAQFEKAGIGRESDHTMNEAVRSDEICWISGESDAGRDWLNWSLELQQYLNRRLFLGLFSFESHFASYQKGDFYKRHLDAFKGQTNRVLSMVVYLNKDWLPEDQGELVLYKSESDQEGIKVSPTFGTVVIFLSEEFPHEVLPAQRERFSIAGWFRVNTSQKDRVDPPE